MKYFVVLFLLLALAATSDISAQGVTAETPSPAAKSPVRTTVDNAVNVRNQTISEAREEMKDKMTQAREAFKEKLSSIKDERKQAIVTNIDNRLNQLNQNSTARLSERVSRLSEILDRIASNAASGEENSELNTQIQEAREALEAASEAIESQKTKDYVVNVTTETALKNAVSTTVRQFVTDIKAVHKLVVDARAEIREAHTLLKTLASEDETTDN